MKNKLVFAVILLSTMFSSFTIHANDLGDSPKLSFTIGATHLTNEGFDALKGTGRTVDDEYGASHFKVSYNISPTLALEAGSLSSSEITSSIYVGSSGTLHGKSYSVSVGCRSCAIGAGEGTLNLKAEIDNSYMFGVKLTAPSKGAFGLYASIGVLYWDVDYTATGAQFTYDGTAKSGRFLEVDGNDAYMGLGISYEINRNSSFALDYSVAKIHESRIRGSSLTWIQSF
jgi:hypothetical protein